MYRPTKQFSQHDSKVGCGWAESGVLLRFCRCRCKNFHRGPDSLFFVHTNGNQVS